MTTTTVTTPAAPADRSPATTGNRTRAGGTGGGSTSTRMRPGAHKENRIGWGFAAPFTILFALFLVWPLLHGLYLSFTGQSLTGQGGELVASPRAPFALDHVRRQQHRPHRARPPATDVAGLDAIVPGQRAHDRAMLAMLANGDDDGSSAEVHGLPCTALARRRGEI